MHKIVFCCHKKKLCHKRGDCDVLKAEKSLSWKLRVYYIKLVKTQRFSGSFSSAFENRADLCWYSPIDIRVTYI